MERIKPKSTAIEVIPLPERMTRLRQASDRLSDLLLTTQGEVTPQIESLLVELQFDKADCVDSFERVYSRIQAEIEDLARLEVYYKKARQVTERRLEAFENFVKNFMNVLSSKELGGNNCIVRIAETTAVEITDANLVPPDFQRVKVEPDKKLIGDALGSGASVPGAKLVINRHLRFKPSKTSRLLEEPKGRLSGSTET